MLKTLLLQAAERFTGLQQVLRYVNQRFAGIALAGDFATMFLVRWDPRTATLECCRRRPRAGLVASCRRRPREMSSTGDAVGLQDQGDWDRQVVCVGNGDRLS